MSDPVRILGVDPGLTRCGLGVVAGPPSAPSLVASRLATTTADQPLPQRLLVIHAAVTAMIREHRPDAVAVEQVLFSKNVRTAMATAQAAGTALLAAAEAGVDATSYSPTDVKATITGYGGADKHAVARLVAAQLHLDGPPRPADVADALAIALCHLGRIRLRTATATPAAGALATAAGEARQASRQGWEAVLDRPHVREAGGA